MKVIAISGKAQHGKDTTAAMLKEGLEADGCRVLITHYGDLVKYVCQTFFNWDGEKNEAGRTLLQHVGTDVIRTKNEDFWVRFIVNILAFFPDEWDYVLIPDCRFPNEITYLRTSGFDVTHLRVIRPGFKSTLTSVQQRHLSETALDCTAADVYLMNDGTLADLHGKITDYITASNGFHQLTLECITA